MIAPHVGYDPERVDALTRLTLESIEALGRIRSDDPEAAGAVLVVRNARRNLEDAWMPLLRQIAASRALLDGPEANRDRLRVEWAATAEWTTDRRHRDVGDDELLDELGRRDEQVPFVRPGGDPAELERWLAGQQSLANELALRVRADPAFADRVVAVAASTPLVAMLAGLAELPDGIRVDLLVATVSDPWWESGWEADKQAAAANALMTTMLDDPAGCLDALTRPGTASTLGGWPPLDQEVVRRFVVCGMRDGPLADPNLLLAGYAAIDRLVDAANGPWIDGRGFTPGMATGLAESLGVYVPTLIPGLENEHSPLVVRSRGVDARYDLVLGTREELVDFVGAIVRTPAAQTGIGTLVDAAVEDALGPRPQVTIGDVAELAELVELAVENEDQELAIAAATRRAGLLRVGGAIGVGIAFGAAAHSARREIATLVRTAATGVAGAVRADTVRGSRVRAVAYETIQLEACRRFVADREVRRRHGAVVQPAELQALDDLLADVAEVFDDAGAGVGARRRAVLDLLGAVRAAGGGPFLDSILEDNSVHDLSEAGLDADL